jgi:hypothetical protein
MLRSIAAKRRRLFRCARIHCDERRTGSSTWTEAGVRKAVAAITAAVLSGLLAGCGAGNNNDGDFNAYIRFVHVTPGADAVNISYDSKTVVSSLAYHGASPYQTVDSGSKKVTVQSVVSGAVYSDTTLSVSNSHYTYLLFGGDSSMSTMLLGDNVADAASGKFNLRVANVATGIGAVDMYLLPVGSTIEQVAPTFSNIAYGGSESFTQFTTGDYGFVVARAGSKDVIYESGKQTMSANAKVTLAVYSRGSGKLANGVLLYYDSSGTTTFVDNSLARFKFVNAATDLGNVDVLVDGSAALANVPYGLLSAYLTIAAGARNFKIQASTSPGAYVYDQNQTLAAASDYSLVAYSVQGTGSAGLIVLADNNLPPASGRAKLRLVNAASDATAYDAYVNFAKLLSGLAPGQASTYQQLDAGTHTVTFTRAGTTQQTASVTLELDSGHVYTIYMYGRNASGAIVTTADY